MRSGLALCAATAALWIVPPAFAAAEPDFFNDPSCSGESMILVERATECYDHWDYGCAKLKVQTALAHQPGCALALWIESFLTERDGDSDAAEAMRSRALRINPKLSDFWEERGHEIEATLSMQEFAHFQVSFDGAEDRDKAWRVLSHLDQIYNEMGSRFGEFPKKKIPVVVFTTPEFLDAWQSPFIGGFFDRRDGKVRVRMDDVPGGEDAYRRIARHEFAHAFMNQYAPLKDLPVWFVEGTAQFYAYLNSDDGFWEEKRLDEIRQERKGYPWLKLPEMEDAIAKKKAAGLTIYLAYLESEALVLHIAGDRGDSWVPAVMTRLRNGMKFDAAFHDVVGVAPDDALEQLRHDWE
ncbi:MAG TPA: hypothetical protein VMU17_07880 [Elusimicrobiota bacterium]|nr:hypothetical protein [Elusimicrobiota bacterium]